MKNDNTLNTQIVALHQKGATASEIAGAFNLQPEIVEVIIKGLCAKKQKQTLEQRYGDVTDIVMRTFIDVAQFSDNDSARVRAAELLDAKVNGGAATEFSYDELAESLNRCREIVNDSVKPLKVLEQDNNTSLNLAVLNA